MTTNDKINYAIKIAKRYHYNKYDGLDYIIHLIDVFMLAKSLNLNENIQIAAILHDIYEDTSVFFASDVNIKLTFGDYVDNLIYAVTNPPHSFLNESNTYIHKEKWNRKEKWDVVKLQIKNFGIDAVKLKLCDRICNLEYSSLTHNSKKANMYLSEDKSFRKIFTFFENDDDLKHLIDLYDNAINSALKINKTTIRSSS